MVIRDLSNSEDDGEDTGEDAGEDDGDGDDDGDVDNYSALEIDHRDQDYHRQYAYCYLHSNVS